MPAVMTKRPRIQIDAPDDVRLALKLEAAKADKSVSELLLEVIHKHFAAAIRDARKYMPKPKDNE